jgi:hypothetical protein
MGVMNGEPIILNDAQLKQQYFDLRWLRKTFDEGRLNHKSRDHQD